MDFISGDLDRVFTVLYEMGRVEPLLKKDWKVLYEQMRMMWPDVASAIDRLNKLQSLRDMRKYLETLPNQVIDALVIEVARELADFQSREGILH